MVSNNGVGDIMIKPNRISLFLLDKELQGLINASAKIFPIKQGDVDNNYNPSNYEYGRIGNHNYRWNNGSWDYIIADDTSISFLELEDIPDVFSPSEHKHTENDIEDLDKYSKSEVNKLILSSLIDKADLIHNHDSLYYKMDDIDLLLFDKSDADHEHMDLYYDKSEVDFKFGSLPDI